jgi:hypothetical protein
MRIHHSAVKSAFFELVRVLEVDLILGDEPLPLRFELFRDTERKGRYRCQIWEREYHRLTPTFPIGKNGRPLHIADAQILVGWYGPQIGDYSNFPASSPNHALKKVIQDFGRFLEHTTFERPINWEALKKRCCQVSKKASLTARMVKK